MNSGIETLNHWGGNLPSFAWPMFWQSSLLIVALFASDFLLRRWLRASIRYTLWLVMLIKLCVPPTFALPTSPAWWLRQTAPPVVTRPAPNYTVTYDNAPLPELPQTSLAIYTPPTTVMTQAAWLLAISTSASGALLFWMLIRWWQIARFVGRAATSERLTALADDARRSLGMKNRVPVRLTVRTMSPAVCGLFRPTILIPQSLTAEFSDEQLSAVLLHELIHLRRCDVWLSFLQTLLQIGYWWHPLVWLANARIHRVREEAVDDAVMLALREQADTYAPTLLEVAKLALDRPLATLGLVGILESRSALRQRIERLVDFRAPRQAGLTLVSLLGILAFTVVAVPMGEGPAPAEKLATSTPLSAATQPVVVTTIPPAILITATIYQMNLVQFEKTISGLKVNPASASSRDPWWSASPEKFLQLTKNLDASGLQPITRPRILTLSGKPAMMYVGDGTNGIEFDCTPLIHDGQVNLSVAGKVVDAKSAEAVTNQFSAETSVENFGGLVVRTKAVGSSGESNVVVVTGVQLVTNDAPRSITNLKLGSSAFANASSGQVYSVGSTNIAGIRADPNFRTVLQALEVRQGSETLREPEITTSSGRGINRISMTNLSVPLAKPSSVPTNSSARLLTYTGLGRQEMVRKLSTIRLDHVDFTATPLAEVLRVLNKEARERDPDHRGINFLINPNFDQPADRQLDSRTGLVLPNAAQTAKDMGSLPITLHLIDITLSNVLDAVMFVAPEPIKYSVQDFAVVFSPHKPEDQLFTRVFKIDPVRVFSQAQRAATNPFIVLSEPQGATTNQLQANVQALRETLARAGVDWNLPPGKALYFNERSNGVYVRVTRSELAVIKRLLTELNDEPPQIHIKARFYEVPKGTIHLESLTMSLNAKSRELVGIMNTSNLQAALADMESQNGSETLAEPEVTTTSGRQTQMRATQFVTANGTLQSTWETNHGNLTVSNSILPQTAQIEIGPVLDVVPYVLADGYTINLTLVPSLQQLLISSNSEPKMLPDYRVQQTVATVNLWDNQTVVLGGLPEKDFVNGQVTPAKSSDKELLVFITATIIDPAGNRVHTDDQLRFAQTGTPPQPTPPK